MSIPNLAIIYQHWWKKVPAESHVFVPDLKASSDSAFRGVKCRALFQFEQNWILFCLVILGKGSTLEMYKHL